MRKEITGILLFFLVVFTLISLLSYSPLDPSIHNATAEKTVRNLFGLLGAHTAGLLIGLFGLGAFWIPILLLLVSIHFFGGHSLRAIAVTAVGGLLLVLTTGGLVHLLVHPAHFVVLMDTRYSSGGMVGIPTATFLIRYAHVTGAAIILTVLWLIGLLMSTGLSLIMLGAACLRGMGFTTHRFAALLDRWQERKKRAEKRARVAKAKEEDRKREIQIREAEPRPVKRQPPPKQEVFEFMRAGGGYRMPPVSLLDEESEDELSTNSENLRMQSKLLEKKLEDFGVRGKVVAVSPGPVVTTFEYEPAPGIKINKIVNLTDDLALALRAVSIRIVAPIPGKAAVGIEIPNDERQVVGFRSVIISDVFDKSKSRLTICLGKDIVGAPVATEMDRMPHLLIAGATGAGKSVALNTMICSLLYKAGPDEVKLIMVDPKRIELSIYNGIPHLITPVVTDVKKATNALFWAVREMERRYELLSETGVKSIAQYNRRIEKISPGPGGETPVPLPYIVIVIDELADLMMVASRDVEVALTRLAQMARAAGIHLILATQRPSVDVLTGIIKANFPTRLSFQVSSKTDSRTILDTNGAESLLGNGDMLFLPPGTGKLRRIHGAYISESELTRITDHWRAQTAPEYDESVTETPVESDVSEGETEYDEKYDEAVALVTRTRQASISMIQRHLRIGYNRAARIIETMEREGLVGPSDGAKPREVLARGYEDV
ncbi:MAG: DNA translocase FtsK 4TM domain-containing protein [Desulfobacteraceae bacterium]|nr:DNA translocase FtsK 4TM domain-containing protein [Desulfobacteraceae bacterium]